MGHAMIPRIPQAPRQENLEEDEGTLNAEDIELLREVAIAIGSLSPRVVAPSPY